MVHKRKKWEIVFEQNNKAFLCIKGLPATSANEVQLTVVAYIEPNGSLKGGTFCHVFFIMFYIDHRLTLTTKMDPWVCCS